MGAIEVTTVTTGIDVDPDGYEVVALPTGGRQAIGINETVVLNNIEQGSTEVRLSRVEGNCLVAGENPRPMNVVGGATIRTTFQVACTEIPRLSFAAIAGTWSGIVTETQPCCVFVSRVTYTLMDRAPVGGQIGTFTIGEQGDVQVAGNLTATSVNGNEYVVNEIVTSGTGAVNSFGIVLTHDPDAETLSYAWPNPVHADHGATGVLERVE